MEPCGEPTNRRKFAPGETLTNPTTLSRLSHEFDLASFVRLVLRRKFFLIAFVTICSLISIVVVLQLDSRYTAKTLVMIETREAKIVELENVIPSIAVSAAAMETQTQILKSTTLDDILHRVCTGQRENLVL